MRRGFWRHQLRLFGEEACKRRWAMPRQGAPDRGYDLQITCFLRCTKEEIKGSARPGDSPAPRMRPFPVVICRSDVPYLQRIIVRVRNVAVVALQQFLRGGVAMPGVAGCLPARRPCHKLCRSASPTCLAGFPARRAAACVRSRRGSASVCSGSRVLRDEYYLRHAAHGQTGLFQHDRDSYVVWVDAA